MSDRYEVGYGPDVVLAPGGTTIGADVVPDDEYALIIGDPESMAYVVMGSAASLRRFAQAVADLADPL